MKINIATLKNNKRQKLFETSTLKQNQNFDFGLQVKY